MYAVDVVNEDPLWSRVNGVDFYSPEMRAIDFPCLARSRYTLEFDLLTLTDPTPTEDVLEQVRSRGLRCPDLPETKSFFSIYRHSLADDRLVSLCGRIKPKGKYLFVQAYAQAFHTSLSLGWYWSHYNWDATTRILVVRPTSLAG
jgi:hypothetical protein